MNKRTLLGLLTPSSNTVLEPLTGAVLADTPDITAHFSRFRVTEISMSDTALGQFDFSPQLAAAQLLADARVDAISWAGTSGGWVGPDNDRELVRQIKAGTGVPATTSTLALLAAFEALNARRYALVTPYLGDVQEAIQSNFAKIGLECVAERHLNDRGNFSFSEFGEEQIAGMVREVAQSRPEAIAIYCTNFNGTRIAAALEEETGIPVLDSVSFTIWHMLHLAGADASRIHGWGQLFSRSPKS
jgi:maleate isomerase